MKNLQIEASFLILFYILKKSSEYNQKISLRKIFNAANTVCKISRKRNLKSAKKFFMLSNSNEEISLDLMYFNINPIEKTAEFLTLLVKNGLVEFEENNDGNLNEEYKLFHLKNEILCILRNKISFQSRF